MMWNNAGSFLVPAVVAEPQEALVVSPLTSGSEADDLDDLLLIPTVTTPVETPCVLRISRRDVYWGVEKALLVQPVHPSFAVQAPRLIHEVKYYNNYDNQCIKINTADACIYITCHCVYT